jgi:hypothetical protein
MEGLESNEGFNRRVYMRREDPFMAADSSDDKSEWEVVSVKNVSSGGLKFLSEKLYEKGDVLWFSLRVVSPRTEYRRVVKSEVLNNYGNVAKKHAYGVIFKEMSNNDHITLDEVLRTGGRLELEVAK